MYYTGSAILLPDNSLQTCLGENITFTCRVTRSQDQVSISRLRWRIQFGITALNDVEESFDQFHSEGSVFVYELRHEKLAIEAQFKFTLTSVRTNVLESALKMVGYWFLEGAVVECGEDLNSNYVATVITIITGMFL